MDTPQSLALDRRGSAYHYYIKGAKRLVDRLSLLISAPLTAAASREAFIINGGIVGKNGGVLFNLSRGLEILNSFGCHSPRLESVKALEFKLLWCPGFLYRTMKIRL
ncbi:hypothetical protein SUGI_1215340 [Cryptomeria japonica]|uniref:Uncharacterized protein n=1 Tax=Cryptomeria japonica TaxID=3369 RepID=A0AAD3NPL4_CRYJA|nr:hypothetical protein SUGI_1215340 [Cryptomeria japonica]